MKSSKLAVESLWNKQAQDEKSFQQAKDERLRMEQLQEEARLKEEEVQKRKEGKDIRKMFTSKPKKTTKKDTKKKRNDRKPSEKALEEDKKIVSPTDEETASNNKETKKEEPITEKGNVSKEMINQSEQHDIIPGDDEDNNEITKPKRRRRNRKGLDFLKIKFVGNNEDAAEEEKIPKVPPSKDIRHMFAKAKQESDDLVKVKSPLIEHKSPVFESLMQDDKQEVTVLLNDIYSNIEINVESNMMETDKKQEMKDNRIKEEISIETNIFTNLKPNNKIDNKPDSVDTTDSKIEDITISKSSKRKRSNSKSDTVITKKLKKCETKRESPVQRCSLRARQKGLSKIVQNSGENSDKNETMMNEKEPTCQVKETDSITSPQETTTLRRSRRSKQKINYKEDCSNIEESGKNVSKPEEKTDMLLDDSVIEINDVPSKEKEQCSDETTSTTATKRDETSITSFPETKSQKPIIGEF